MGAVSVEVRAGRPPPVSRSPTGRHQPIRARPSRIINPAKVEKRKDPERPTRSLSRVAGKARPPGVGGRAGERPTGKAG